MKFNTKTRYGIRAMLEISLNKEKDGVFQKDIAKNQNISVKYLDHIIHSLKTARLISNLRGKKSGYILTREPSKITMNDIHNAFDPGICVVDCLSNGTVCDMQDECSARGFYGELNKRIIGYLKEVTLEDLQHDPGFLNSSE